MQPEPDGYSIVPATWRDLRDLRALERVCFDLDAWPLIDLLGVLTFPGVQRWKAVYAGKLIGFAAADMRGTDKTGWITTIGVLPEHRRRGIASQLLERCESGLGAPRVRLCVRKSNLAAIRMYELHGYQYVETWANYYVGGESALVLEKML